MDWTDQPELLAIFQQEIEERSGHLVGGARAILSRQLLSSSLPDLVRHAHTIKGSARIMGLPTVAFGAAALERAWRSVQEEALAPSDQLGHALLGVSSLLVVAAGRERSGDVLDMEAATVALEGLLPASGRMSDHPSIGGATSPLQFPGPGGGTSPPAGRSTAAERPPPAPAPAADAPVRSTSPPPPPTMVAADSPREEAFEDPTGLGGLISSIESMMIGSTTAVDSSTLYRLINRAVEANLDTEALAKVAAEGRLPAGAIDRLAHEAGELVDMAVSLAQARLHEVTETFPQFMRYLARRANKEIRFEVVGDDVRVDRQVLDALREPLRHLLVNAVDHGIEAPVQRSAAGKSPTGTVSLHAQIVGNRLVVTVADDGQGIDWQEVAVAAAASGRSTDDLDISAHLFAPGFSTVITANDFSGDGMGLAAVAEVVERLNGGIRLESKPGQGTTVVVTVPASLALQNVLLVKSCGQKWGLPDTAVLAHFPVAHAELRAGDDRMELWYQGEAVPIASLASVLGVHDPEAATEVVLLATRTGTVAITVPEVIGRRRVAVKGLGPILSGAPHLSAAAVLGGGEVVVVVEPNQVGDRARRLPTPKVVRPRILIVDDSRGVRQLIGATLSSKGFEVMVAADAGEAARVLSEHKVDAMVVDYSMPGSDGVELVRRLREGRYSLPIIMVSSVADTVDQARAWEAGVDAYLDKFDLRKGALAATLKSLLEMRGGGERTR